MDMRISFLPTESALECRPVEIAATRSEEMKEAARKADTFPTRALAEIYQQAKRDGKTELAELFRTELKRRNKF